MRSEGVRLPDPIGRALRASAAPERDATSQLTARQKRELAFYEEHSRLLQSTDVDFAPVTGNEQRPWNPAWFVFQQAQDLFQAGSRTLLDVGCGTGLDSARFARIGYHVTGIDLSPSCIRLAKDVAQKYGFAERTDFRVGPVEAMPWPDETFDVVAGFDILHHVEVEPAVTECLRVLKKGGVALFKEWIEVGVIDSLRNCPPLRWIFPAGRSIEREVTEDERKLTADDVVAMRAICPNFTVHRFRVLARLNRLVRVGEGVSSPLEKVDAKILRRIPAAGKLGGTAVLVLKKGLT